MILEAGEIRTAPFGTMTVSMTDRADIAWEFARISLSCPDHDEEGAVVIVMDHDVLKRNGIKAEPYEDQIWGDGECAWEREWATGVPIPSSCISGIVMRRKFDY